MKDYRDEPVSNHPMSPLHINIDHVRELQDALNGTLSRILDGLSGNPCPHGEGMKPSGMIETAEILVEQAKENCMKAESIYDMLLGER